MIKGAISGLPRHLVALLNGLRLSVSVLAVGAILGAFLLPGGATGAASAAGPTIKAASPTALARAAASQPVQLIVPKIRVKAAIVPIRMHGTQLDPPSNWHQVGWWTESTKPGLALGKTVLTGHTVHWGGGVFNDLGSVRKGQLVEIKTKNGKTIAYSVQSTKNYNHTQLSRKSKSLFGQTSGTGDLVLVTCGNYNGHEYLTNIVVKAKVLGFVIG